MYKDDKFNSSVSSFTVLILSYQNYTVSTIDSFYMNFIVWLIIHTTSLRPSDSESESILNGTTNAN